MKCPSCDSTEKDLEILRKFPPDGKPKKIEVFCNSCSKISIIEIKE